MNEKEEMKETQDELTDEESVPIKVKNAQTVIEEEDEETETEEENVKDDSVPLEAQLAELQTKADEYLQGLQRERAEFINYKRRVERERTERYQQAKRDVVAEILPVFDDFERAISNVPDEVRENDWIKGIEMIQRKLNSVLDNLGISEIEALGQPFDPNLHEAIGRGESEEYESDHVMDVLQKGYKHGEKVIRPALVRVAV